MNTSNETLASQLELAARIVREGLEWEYAGSPTPIFDEWFPSDVKDDVVERVWRGFGIRLKPFTLPDPPPGRRWHRTDGWTKDMLDGGWRTLLEGEAVFNGDELLSRDGSMWTAQTTPTEGIKPSDWMNGRRFRTRRPLPPASVPWSCPEDVPGPVCWVRNAGEPSEISLIVGFGLGGILLSCNDGQYLETWADLQRHPVTEHSLDRRTWHPCTKPAKP